MSLPHRRARRVLVRAVSRIVEPLEQRVVLDATYHPLASGSLVQNWESAVLTTNDVWDDVPSVIGYRGDGLVGPTGVDPQTVLAFADGTNGPVVDVIVNQTSPGTNSSGGVAEFELATPIGTASKNTGNRTIALQGSGTADAPFVLFHVDSTGMSQVRLAYDLIDIDGSADNAIQPIALQYRIGESGDFVNVSEGFIADATVGDAAGNVNSLDVTLPAEAAGQSQLQIRIITTNAVGSDEWVAIDNVKIFGNDPVAGTIQFDPTTYSVNEDAGTASITVVRVGGSAGAVSVSYSTANGSATAPGDYIGVGSGFINFANGDTTPKTITIDIVDDLDPEAGENFFINLSNPTNGAVLGTAQAVVNIIDNDVTIAPTVLLNEIVVNPSDADGSDEYVELRGPANEPLLNTYFVSVEGEGTGAGLADLVINLSSASLGNNGLLVIKGNNGPSTPGDTAVVNDARFDNASGALENGSNSFLIIFSPTPILEGTDLDIDNDGVLDLPAGATLVDGVGSIAANSPNDRAYGAVLNAAVNGSAFDFATRIVNENNPNDFAAWYYGETFDPIPVSNSDDSGFRGYNPFDSSSNTPAAAVVTPGETNYVDGTGSAGSLYLTPAFYTVDESVGQVAVSVVRIGGTSGTLAVDYNTLDTGTATVGADFTATSGTLTFNNGENVKSFNVNIVDDTETELAETIDFQVDFNDVAGISFGSITISQNDAQLPNVVLNEISVNPPGTDQPFEYVEIRGTANASLVGLYFVTIEGDSGTTLGQADRVFNLSSFSLGANGLLVIKAVDGGFVISGDTAVAGWTEFNTGSAGIENGSNTFALAFSPDAPIALNTDLDTNDDGTLDLPAGVTIIDSIGWTDGGASDLVYSPAVLTQLVGTPDAATRFPTNLTPNSADAWYNADLTGASDSVTYDELAASTNFPPGGVLTPGLPNYPGSTATVSSISFNFLDGPQSLLITGTNLNTLSVADFTLTNLTTPGSVPGALFLNIAPDGNSATILFNSTGNPNGDSILVNGDYRIEVPSLSFQQDFFFVNADFTRDRAVDFSDLLALARNFNQPAPLNFSQGDGNYDGVVDFSDLLNVARNFGTTLIQSSPASTFAAKARPADAAKRSVSGELFATKSVIA